MSYRIDMFANGVVAVREKGEPNKGALPILVDVTPEEALRLTQRLCVRARDGSGAYSVPDVSGRWDDFERVEAAFKAELERIRGAEATPPDGAAT